MERSSEEDEGLLGQPRPGGIEGLIHVGDLHLLKEDEVEEGLVDRVYIPDTVVVPVAGPCLGFKAGTPPFSRVS